MIGHTFSEPRAHLWQEARARPADASPVPSWGRTDLASSDLDLGDLPTLDSAASKDVLRGSRSAKEVGTVAGKAKKPAKPKKKAKK